MSVFRKYLDKALEFLCCSLLVFMTLAASWQVVSRYILNNPSTATEELTLIAFVWMSLFAAAYVFGKKDHMKMTFVLDKFKGKSNLRLRMLAEVVTLIFALLVLVFGGFKISGLSMEQASASLGIPMGYVYLALPFSGIVTALYNLLNLIELKSDLINKNKQVVNEGGK